MSENIVMKANLLPFETLDLYDILDIPCKHKPPNVHRKYIYSDYGLNSNTQDTKGWEIYLLWTNSTTTWNKLKNVQDSYPIEIAILIARNKLSELPVFVCWYNNVGRKVSSVLPRGKGKYKSQSHKYGIRIPKSVAEAYTIEKKKNTS